MFAFVPQVRGYEEVPLLGHLVEPLSYPGTLPRALICSRNLFISFPLEEGKRPHFQIVSFFICLERNLGWWTGQSPIVIPLSNALPRKSAEAVMLLTSVREVSSSNLGRDTGIFAEVFCCFPPSYQAGTRIVPQIRPWPHLPHPFQFITGNHPAIWWHCLLGCGGA